MKKRKILFGIIAAILLFGTFTANSQNYDEGLQFLGPNNLAGRSRAIVIERTAVDDNAAVLYTGGVAGGLFKSINGGKTWMPVLDNAGKEFVLPISCMIQNEGKLLIGTGEGLSVSNLDRKGLIIPKGKGIYQYDPATSQFTCVIVADQNLEYVNKMVVNGGYLYFATNTGLFRATMGAAQYETIFDGGKVEDLDFAGERLFFTSGAKVYFLENGETGVEYKEVLTNAPQTASRIEIAVAPTDPTYIYMAVADQYGLLEGVYMTSTSSFDTLVNVLDRVDTVVLDTIVDTTITDRYIVDSTYMRTDSTIIGIDTTIMIDSIVVDLDSVVYVFDTVYDYRIDSIYSYDYDTTFAYDTTYTYGYTEVFKDVNMSAYDWNKISTSTVVLFTSGNGWYSNTLAVSPTDPKKLYLGGTNLWVAQGLEGTNIFTWAMESDYAYGRPSAFYVHENIHDIAFLNDSVYYLATDGGIFKYGEIYDGVAIVGESGVGFSELNRGLTTTQFVSVAVANDGSVMGGAIGHAMPYIKSREDSDITTPTDDPVNRTAESIWYGNGSWGGVSMIHQVAPTEKEVIFVGAEGADFGRATSDYFNTANSQAWTIGENFNSTKFYTSTYNPVMLFWENTEDALIADTLSFDLKAPFVIRREGVDMVANLGFYLMEGDTVMVRDQGHTDYPVAYRIPISDTLRAEGIFGSIKNPIQSRLFVAAITSQYDGSLCNYIYMTYNATDFRKVGGNAGNGINWIEVANLRESVVRAMAITEDGNCLYIGVENSNGGSEVVRVRELATVNPRESGVFTPNGPYQGTVIDTILSTDRVITSMSVSFKNDRLVVTCAGEGDGNNFYYVENATDDQVNVAGHKLMNGIEIYSSLIEKETDSVFVGTVDGVYTLAPNADATLAYYGLKGTPITFIKQQTATLKFRRATYYTGTNSEEYRFGKTKYPGAIYFATYGRGIYVDKTYVTDFGNEIGINSAVAENINDVRIYPNPAASYTNIELEITNTTDVAIRIFDMSGKVVYTKSLDNLTEGVYIETINCQKLQKGIYLINVLTDSQMMTSKLIVK